jgi:hypothetical protein
MPGPCRAIVLSLSTLLACGGGVAHAADPSKRPLQLKLAATPSTAPVRAQVRGPARATRFRTADQNLGERALASLLDGAEEPATAPADGGTFQFKRRGNVGRDLAHGYKDMCDAVSRKVWDDPNGKRVKFDVAGKPGVGIEIPLR